ncbi:hypothetical protein PC128_g21937 [Phytophthora cactorum]|nr:hypothetical protein PC128_g21937 [Phytophthora cactorum]
MAKGSTTVPATPSKSGGARNESSSPDVTTARLAAVSELSVSFEDEEEHGPDAQDDYDDYEDKTPAPDPGAATPETATLSSGLSGATKSLSRNLAAELDDVAGPDPDYDDFNDGAEGSKPSVASAKRSALLNARRPPINGDTSAAKRVFDRVETLMKNDEWMQLFKPIPKRKAEWPAFAHELQYPVNSVSTSQIAEDLVSLLLALGYENETYPSTMSLQDWSPHEAGAALQKWKKKLRKAFGAIGINEGKQPVSRLATLEEELSKVLLPATPKRLERTPPTKRGADRDAFGTADASPYHQNSHMVTPRSTSRMRRMDAEDEGSRGCRGFTQTALSRYYSAKRERNEHLCDYLNRLNGYARNARLQFEKGGRDAKEHVQQFLVTCGDDNMAESLYHTRVNDIHELEDIIEDVLKGKERMAKRDGVTRHTHGRDSRLWCWKSHVNSSY